MGKTVVAVIPARYASTRFPGKPLIDLGGKPMIVHVLHRVQQAKLIDRVLVATDDERIRSAVESAGGEAVMTDSSLASGTDRVQAAVQGIPCDVVANVQGDEPLIEPEQIDEAIRILLDDESVQMGTLVHQLSNLEDLFNPNVAKVVLDQQGYALYFSRSVVPFIREQDRLEEGLNVHPFYKHVGLYVYRKAFLKQYAGWQPTALEIAEKLEQLRALENGVRIKTAITRWEPVCVDTPEDAERVRHMMAVHSERN